MSVTGVEFAQACEKIVDKFYSYKEMDCQAMMEAGLRACGLRMNWRGSNHMWREALSWKGTVNECVKKFGEVPVGAWLFTIKHDGGEVARGYKDNEGNAAHVGCYTGTGKGSVHSTGIGTQEADFPDDKRWTHVGLCSLLDYSRTEPLSNLDKLREGLHSIHDIVEQLLEELV